MFTMFPNYFCRYVPAMFSPAIRRVKREYVPVIAASNSRQIVNNCVTPELCCLSTSVFSPFYLVRKLHHELAR